MGITMPTDSTSFPEPPRELISRVSPGSDLDWFFRSGRESVLELERTLGVVGRSIGSFESILDFGCGCGRMLIWMRDIAATARLHGTDIDAEVIEWCRAHIPHATVEVNGADPPLPYPEDAFDLVFNRSVFTHLDERRQDLWLTELQRVTRAGGLVVLSTFGEHAVPEGDWKLRDDLEQDGIVFRDETMPREFGYPDWYQNTWHAPWYVFEHWGRWFDIRAYVPSGALGDQDQILLERRSGDEGRAPLTARPRLRADGAQSKRVSDVLAAGRASRSSGPTGSSLFGSLGAYARRLVLRAIRPYTFHQDNFDEAVARSIAELTRVTDYHTAVLEGLERQRDKADS